MFFRIKTSGPRAYLQIVENHREDGAHRQHVIATLGRVDELEAAGGLATLLASGARLCQQVMLLSAFANDADGPRLSTCRIGAPLLFGRLWDETGCRAVIEDLLAGRGFEFAVRARHLRHRAPPPDRLGLRPGLREVAGGLRCFRH